MITSTIFALLGVLILLLAAKYHLSQEYITQAQVEWLATINTGITLTTLALFVVIGWQLAR